MMATTNNNTIWTTSNLNTIGGSATMTGNNITIGGSYGYGYLQDSIFSTESSFATAALTFLSETELRDLLEKFKNRGVSKDEFQNIVREIVTKRHCSEQFILDFLDLQNMDKNIARIVLERMHKADINSGEYAEINLLLQLTELEN